MRGRTWRGEAAGLPLHVLRRPRPVRPRDRLVTTLGVVVLAIALFVAGGLGLFRTVGGTPAQDAGTGVAPSSGLSDSPLIMNGTVQQAVASLQGRLRAAPGDWRSWAILGMAYVQEARVIADPRYYPKAQGALHRSLSLHRRGNFEAFTGQGALALARHDFAAALRWGRKAMAVNPYNANVFGVIGDAQIELGRYESAFRTLQQMVDLRPDLSSYARASYARELQGDVPGAVHDMRLALRAAGTPDDQAFTCYYLGELAFNSGHVARALRWYRRGAALAPEYYPPQAGIAKVEWAEGRLTSAIRDYRSLVARYPLPEYAIALGDLYAVTGQTAAARKQYDLVRAEERLFEAARVNVDLELALFDADHGRPRKALAAARAEWARRHSVVVADALAWALHQNGLDREALRYVRLSHRVGYRNALFRFHQGMIEMSLGLADPARRHLRSALSINPHFSILYARAAERVLSRLGGVR
jgi:tetratricopeptide (TPR) repeat protein